MRKLIVFFSSWCIPCEEYNKILSSFKSEHQDIEFVSYDVDSDDPEIPKLISSYKIRSVPTTVYLVDGEMKVKRYGLITLDELNNIIAE